MAFGEYFQAQVSKKECWFLVAILRSFEHLSFDRTYDRETSTFEFFVPLEQKKIFLEIMAFFQEKRIVTTLSAMPNRLMKEDL